MWKLRLEERPAPCPSGWVGATEFHLALSESQLTLRSFRRGANGRSATRTQLPSEVDFCDPRLSGDAESFLAFDVEGTAMPSQAIDPTDVTTIHFTVSLSLARAHGPIAYFHM